MSFNLDTVDTSRVCSPHIVEAGFAHRGEKIIHREKQIYQWMITDLMASGNDDEFDDDDDFIDDDDPNVLTMEILESVLSDNTSFALASASFLAGRCQPEKLHDQMQLTTLLQEALNTLPVESLRDQARAYIEMAMSLALRGEVTIAKQALSQVVSGQVIAAGQSYLAAFYLAQLGDPSGYSVMLETLESSNHHYRLMATRHLLGFQPYDGKTVDGKEIDIKAALIKSFYDSEDYVRVEVPFLMAEAEIGGLSEILRSFIEESCSEKATLAAQKILDDLES